MVRLESFSVPPLVEAGTVSNIVLDCPYSITKNEKKGLVLKWYLNSLHIPIYQWIPPNHPSGLGIMGGKIDFDFQMGSNPYSKHRALSIKSPTISMSGHYTCKVSTVQNEVSLTSTMVVYAPPKTMSISQSHIFYQLVNVSCMVDRCFPRPEIKIIIDGQWFSEGYCDGVQFKR